MDQKTLRKGGTELSEDRMGYDEFKRLRKELDDSGVDGVQFDNRPAISGSGAWSRPGCGQWDPEKAFLIPTDSLDIHEKRRRQAREIYEHNIVLGKGRNGDDFIDIAKQALLVFGILSEEVSTHPFVFAPDDQAFIDDTEEEDDGSEYDVV